MPQRLSLSPTRLDAAAVIARAAGSAELRALIGVIMDRAARWTAQQTLAVPGELIDWWHVSWERLGDVAFAQALSPDPARKAWLRDETLRLCALPADDWVGPFFRPRLTPMIGMLETAHVGLGVATVLELCPDLFDPAERASIEATLIDSCLLPCERALVARETGVDVTSAAGPERYQPSLQNWYCVLLDAYGAVALLTGDQDRIAALPERFNRAQGLHNADSYGESVQYWGYAALHLSNLWELINLAAPELVPRLDRTHTAMVPWLAHAVMFPGRRRDWGPGSYTTMINFGDSAYTARPPADVLTSIARFGDDPGAGLARWLYELTYADPELAPGDLSSFGFFNQIGWRTVVNLLEATGPVSPEQAGLTPAREFETGAVVVRDRWPDATAVLAAQAGHRELNVDSHRHDDDGSFVLGYGGEVFFTDPGHCCYRLRAYQDAVADTAHSTWALTDPDGHPLVRQRRPHQPVGRRRAPVTADGITTFGVDLADLYPDHVRRAERTWICALPHVVIIVDELEADRPVAVDTRFVIDNRDNRLAVNQATPSRLVFRRGPAAAKFFRLAADSDGQPNEAPPRRSWSSLHDVYHPQPNAPTQGKEGSGVVYTFSAAPAKRFRSVYSIVLADEAGIRGWHVDHDGAVITIRPPAGEPIMIDPARHRS